MLFMPTFYRTCMTCSTLFLHLYSYIYGLVVAVLTLSSLIHNRLKVLNVLHTHTGVSAVLINDTSAQVYTGGVKLGVC